MKESDIRPTAMRTESAKLQAKDIEKILAHQGSFQVVPCPACEAAEYDFTFKKRGFEFVTCSSCQTLFINPRPTAEMLKEHYQNSLMQEYWNKHIYPASEEMRRKNIFVPRAERVVELCRNNGVKGGRLLDVGAGFGTFCQEIQRLAFFKEVIAVEPSRDFAASCRKKGLTVIERTIEEVSLPEAVDVMTNFELIAHLHRPQTLLLQCRNLLRKGGLIIFTTPNVRGFDLLMLRDLSDNINGPTHLNYFHAASLSKLLERCGFEVLETQTPGKLDVHVVKNKIDSGEFSVESQPFMKELLVERWDSLAEPFQKFLADHGLSSHLWIVAKKR